ncbi:MAG: endonuclease III [Campylobacterales bacterium]|nr:endonuclease III [Campylobacterales bacterium]
MKKATKQEILEIKKLFLEHYSDKKTELNYRNLYELCVSVMLSAQCTDKRVNQITPKLFQTFPDIETLSNASLEEVKELINSCSYFNNKAKNLINFAKNVKERFNSNIPLNEEDLKTLSGIGQKTANVVMIEFANKNLMAVDTHVFRTSHRLGLSNQKSAIKTEEELSKKFKTDLNQLHQAMVLFGRYICKAKNPSCHECFLTQFCKSTDNFKPQ